MKIVITSFFIVIVNLLYVLSLPYLPGLEGYAAWKDLVITAVAFFIFAEAVMSTKKPLEESGPSVASSAPVAPVDRNLIIDAEIVHFLGLLQERGRFLDFLMDDITPYDNTQVGAAARVVHQGCGQILREYFDIQPVEARAEGETVALNEDYDPRSYRIVGETPATAAFSGRVLHRGWKTAKVSLPRVATPAQGATVVTPAEIEVK